MREKKRLCKLPTHVHCTCLPRTGPSTWYLSGSHSNRFWVSRAHYSRRFLGNASAADIGHSIGVGEFLGIESEFTGRVAQSPRLWGSKSKNFPRTEREELGDKNIQGKARARAPLSLSPHHPSGNSLGNFRMETVQPSGDVGGGRLSPSSDRKEMLNSDIRQENANDAGDGEIDVEALLSRPRGFSSRMGRRSVYEAPEFVRRLNAFEEAEAGSTVIFECQWKGFPRPAIKWYKDDEEITENARYQVTAGDQGILALVIEEARKEDEGAYKCKAENQEGVASTTGYLSVSGEIEEKPLAAQPRKNQDHSVSSAPPLRTIMEQRTLEAEEEEELSQQPPSPIQDFIDSLPRRMRGRSRKKADKANSEEGDEETSGSDTSVDSQDFDRVPDRDRDLDVDRDQDPNLTNGTSPQQSELTSEVVNQENTGKDTSQETENLDPNKGQGQSQTLISQDENLEKKAKITTVEEDQGSKEVKQEENLDTNEGQGQSIVSPEVQHEQPTLPISTVVVQQSSEIMQTASNSDTAQVQGQGQVQPSNVPDAAEEQQVPTTPVVVVHEEESKEAEESLGRVPSDKAMSMFVKSVSEMTPSPSVEEPDAENDVASASVELPTQVESDTELVQFEVKTDNPPIVEKPPTPEKKPEEAAGPQEPGSPHRSEMVLMVGVSQPAEIQKSTEKEPEVKSESAPTTPVVAAQVKVEPIPGTPVIQKPTEIPPQTEVNPAITTVSVKSTESAPSASLEEAPKIPILITTTEDPPENLLEPSAEVTPGTPIIVKSTEIVPETTPVVKSTQNVPQIKVEPATPLGAKVNESEVQMKVEPVSTPSVIIKSSDTVPQVKVQPVNTSSVIIQSKQNVPQPLVEPTPVTSVVLTSTENMPESRVQTTPTPPVAMQLVGRVPQSQAVVSSTVSDAFRSAEIVPKTHVILSEEQKQMVVISTNQKPVSKEAGGSTTAVVSPTPRQESSTVPGITVILETTGKEATPIDTKAEGTVSNIIKMVKQKSMAMEETLRIPWLYYFAFTVVASFIATATDCSPFHYIIVIAVVSLISFRVLVEITCKENDA